MHARRIYPDGCKSVHKGLLKREREREKMMMNFEVGFDYNSKIIKDWFTMRGLKSTTRCNILRGDLLKVHLSDYTKG